MRILQIIKKVIAKILIYASLIFASFVALIPVVSCVITAFKPTEEYNRTNVMTLPEVWGRFSFSLEWLKEAFDNFISAWVTADMFLAFQNTVIIMFFVLIGSVMTGSMLAYILSRFKFPGNGLIRTLFLIASMLPGIAMQVSLYQIMYNIGFVNTLYGYIIMSMGTDVISIYIFIQFFENISTSLDESAIMDGCTYFGVFFKILFPLLKPAIVTVLILKGVGTYNEYYSASLYLQDKTKYVTVATCLYKFSGPLGNQYNLICAGVLITLLPPLIIFILCQKQIYNGLTLGAVKG